MEVNNVLSDFPQLIKGVLETCILSLIAENESYGYALIQSIQEEGFGQVSKGSVYPILLKLETEGWIKGELRLSDKGPKQKFYSITPAGRTHLKELKDTWYLFQEITNRIIKEKKNGE